MLSKTQLIDALKKLDVVEVTLEFSGWGEGWWQVYYLRFLYSDGRCESPRLHSPDDLTDTLHALPRLKCGGFDGGNDVAGIISIKVTDETVVMSGSIQYWQELPNEKMDWAESKGGI